MPKQALFLDVGNTLLYEEPSRFAIYAETAARRGVAIDDVGMKALMSKAHHELPREIEGAFRYSDTWFRAFIRQIFHGALSIPEDELEPIAGELFATFEDERTFHLFPDAREVLADLREAGVVLGVISNWSARLPHVLSVLDLEQAFDFVLCSAIERVEKPDPVLFERALERAGVRPDEAAHAGDHPEKDVRGAQRVGITGVLVDHLDARSAEIPEGAIRVRGLRDLGAYILGST